MCVVGEQPCWNGPESADGQEARHDSAVRCSSSNGTRLENLPCGRTEGVRSLLQREEKAQRGPNHIIWVLLGHLQRCWRLTSQSSTCRRQRTVIQVVLCEVSSWCKTDISYNRNNHWNNYSRDLVEFPLLVVLDDVLNNPFPTKGLDDFPRSLPWFSGICGVCCSRVQYISNEEKKRQGEVQKNLEHTWKILMDLRYILNDAEN